MANSTLKDKLPNETKFKERAAEVRRSVKENAIKGSCVVLTSQNAAYRGSTGIGTLTHQEENCVWSGQWNNGVLHGFGTRHYEGSWYEGEWKNGEMSGIGRYVHKTGGAYFGEWLCNKSDGFGRWEYPDSRVHIGELEGDSKHGKGIYYDPKRGDIWDGEWRFGKFVDGGVTRLDGHKDRWRNGKQVRKTC